MTQLKKKSGNATKTTLSKRERIKELMSEHSVLFLKEGVKNPKFIPRLCYMHKGQKIVGFYPSEIKGEQDIYAEFCDRNDVPEDPERTLYKWKYNAHYEEEYETSEPHPVTGDKRYLIPVDELLIVKNLHIHPVTTHALEENSPEVAELVISEDLDVPYSQMTLRDYAAIKWRKPVSSKRWLNELIMQTEK